jgi:lysozyme
MVTGLDVSDHQPSTQWQIVAHTGAGFSFVKATEGVTFTNPDFSTDWPAVKRNGLVRGAYHYFHPDDDPVQQADFFLTTVGNFESTDLPPLFDWEKSDHVAVASDVQKAVAWLERVEAATGKTPIIYTNLRFWGGVDDPEAVSRYPLFIADYQDPSCPAVPPPWSGWAFWQYTETGKLAGVSDSKGLDLDTFNGTLSDLKLFASTGVY